MTSYTSVELVPACYADVVYIARNLREADAEEVLPLTWGGTPENLAAGVIAVGGKASVALSADVPVAAFGAHEARPLCWSVWMFATDRWPEVALSVTKMIKRELGPALIKTGAVRADCWTIETHHTAHRWLELLGAAREATVEDYGATRKKFHCYSWTRSRLERAGGSFYVFRPIRSEDALDATHASTSTPARAAANA